jgi:SAM-dependent methyltransferase
MNRLRSAAQKLSTFVFRWGPLREWRIRHYDDLLKRPHPIDSEYGIHTSGAIASEILYGSKRAALDYVFYVGSQPGVIRRSLALIPNMPSTILIDLGCGKGRVLAVASEFPFREIVGVELSESLAFVAAKNMEIVRRRFTKRSPIRVVVDDAVEFPFPDSPLAIFLFNPFGKASMRRLVSRLETALAGPWRSHGIHIVYYNPVHGALFDDSPAFVRTHALCIPYDEYERRVENRDASSTVVIWRDDRAHAVGEPTAEATRRIRVLDDGAQ